MPDASPPPAIPAHASGRPQVATIPSGDAVFRGLVDRLLDELGDRATSEDLQAALRAHRPRALVRASVITRVPAVWYAYRDGGFPAALAAPEGGSRGGAD